MTGPRIPFILLASLLVALLPATIGAASAPHPTRGPYHGATLEDQTMVHYYDNGELGCLAAPHDFVVDLWFEPTTATLTLDVQTHQATGTGGHLTVTIESGNSCANRLIEVTGVEADGLVTYEMHVDRQLCPCDS